MNKILIPMSIDFLNYFFLIGSVFGILLFLCMINSLKLLKKIDSFANKSYSIKKLEQIIDYTFNLDFKKLLLSSSKLIGSLLCLITVYVLHFFIFKFNFEKLSQLFSVCCNHEIILILLKFIKIFAILSFISIFIFGLLLILNKKLVEKIIILFDNWYDVDKVIEEKLEKTIAKDFDTICFLRNKPIGIFGLFLSIILLILTVINIVWCI